MSFADGHSLKFDRALLTDSESLMDSGALDSSYIHIAFYDKEKEIESFDIKEDYVDGLVRQASHVFPWEDEEDDRSPLLKLTEKYSLHNDVFIQNEARNTLLFLSSLEVAYVSARRLEMGAQIDVGLVDKKINVIENISDSISGDFTEAQAQFAEISKKTDASFITRLIDRQSEKHIDDTIIQLKLDLLRKKIDEYKKYQLVPDIQLLNSLPSLDRNKEVLLQYILDMETKMDALSSFYDRLKAFDTFVSDCVLSDKEMRIGPKGLSMVNIKGDFIRLDQLSDGEQDLIILAFFLTYKAKPNTLLLIDEPENSLHMSWLESLLDGFIAASKAAGNQIIVATHSPAFINGQWNMTFDLFDNNQHRS